MLIKAIKLFLKTITDSLFPISNADKLLFSYTKEQAFEKLPRAGQTPFLDTYSVLAYKNELVTRLIWNIKYKKNMQAVRIGGYALYEEITNNQDPITNNQILLVPIPITQKRRKERGFNQCELLVDEILRLDKTGRLITYKDLLIRTIHQDRQTLKDRKERLEDAKGVFSINEMTVKAIISKKKIADTTTIVIDDVITTGSTMKEAMETLKKAGFVRVIGISLAH